MEGVLTPSHGNGDGYIRYGDIICLYTTSYNKHHGFLQADGIIEDSMRVVVPSEKPQGLEFPSNIRKCLFQMMPMGQYAAQSEYEEKKQELEHLVGTDEDKDNNVKDYLDSLRESAEKEKCNDELHWNFNY